MLPGRPSKTARFISASKSGLGSAGPPSHRKVSCPPRLATEGWRDAKGTEKALRPGGGEASWALLRCVLSSA
eukprot:scaffold39880_cov38-Prasinocladus_malaysianus.AAC.1